MRHEYLLKDNAGNVERTIDAFAINKDLLITVIEKGSTAYRSAYPPKLDYWLSRFGRKLNHTDSVALLLK